MAAYFDLGEMDFSGLANIDWAALGYPQFAQQAPAPSPTGMLSGATQAPAPASYYDAEGTEITNPDQILQMQQDPRGAPPDIPGVDFIWRQNSRGDGSWVLDESSWTPMIEEAGRMAPGTGTKQTDPYHLTAANFRWSMDNNQRTGIGKFMHEWAPIAIKAGLSAAVGAATGGASFGGLGATAGGAAAGATNSALNGGNVTDVLTGALTGGVVGGLGGMASDYFGGATNPNDYAFSDGASLGTSTPNWDMYASPITGTQPGWAGGTPVDSGYQSTVVNNPYVPEVIGPSYGQPGWDGGAPSGYTSDGLSNSATRGYASPMMGGDYVTNYDSLYADGLGGVDTSGGYTWDGLSNTATYAPDTSYNGLGDFTADPYPQGAATGNWYDSILSAAKAASPYAGLLAAGLKLGGGYLAGKSAVDAAQTSSDAQIKAAQIAESAKFRPVGITTNFGSSNFTKDAQGNVTGAGYTLSPEMLAQQAKLMGVSEQALQQYLGAQGATAPMGDAAQRMMTLGNSYLATTPQEQAAKYMAEQQALLATGRERYVNNMLTGEYNRGTYGLSVGGTSTGMNAANPRLEALFNAQRQQDLGLAAQATQGGMDYAKFGGAMTGLGGSMLRDMYGTQTAAYDPYKTALGGATSAEALGQDSLKLGMDMGNTVTAANARSGTLLANGMTNAATTMQPANAYSPWGAMLSGAGTQLNAYNNPNPTYDPRQFRLVPYGQ